MFRTLPTTARPTIASVALVLLALSALAQAPEEAPLPPAAPEGVRAEEGAETGRGAEEGAETGRGAAEGGGAEAAAPAGEAADADRDPEGAAGGATGAAAGAEAGAPADAPAPPVAPEEEREDAEAEEAGEAAAEAEAAAETANEEADAGSAADALDNEVDEPGEPIVVAPPEAGPAFDPAAAEDCEAALAGLGARFERVEALEGDGSCGAPRPLRLSAVGGVELRPEIRVRCPVARALALWIDRVAVPLSRLYMEQEVSAVLTATGYQCRRRRGDGTAKWSEHAFANAIDVSGVMFENGDVMAIRPRSDSEEPERSFQAGIRGGACAFFTTVLGPMTNGAHADHLHLDMAERRGGYRLCE